MSANVSQKVPVKNGNSKRKQKKPIRKIPELVLPTSKLKFTSEQLQNLNFIFNKKLARLQEENNTNLLEKSKILARSVSERLIQRLICGVGILDNRFSAKYLITLNDSNWFDYDNLDYLIRLDTLSVPVLYEDILRPQHITTESDPEYPAGYARIRMHASQYGTWGDFCNTTGYLRRDRIQAKFVKLLAEAASSEFPNSPLSVDEGFLCGSPGKILNPYAAYKILKTKSHEQVFFGGNGINPRFPDPRDFRLAIVDEPEGIKMRIEFLSPALSNIHLNVRLLVAIGVDSWPASADFPRRISLIHSDALVFQKSALTGMYLVGFGVQSSAWQIRLPAAEYCLINNYSSCSTVQNILTVLVKIFAEIGNKTHTPYHVHQIVPNYLLKCAVLHELEIDTSLPTTATLNWSPLCLSTLILKILDKLVICVRRENYPNYFFNKVNLLANPGHLNEEDYIIESNRIYTYILKLFDMSSMSTIGDVDFERMISDQNLEMLLLSKWKELVDGLLPPPSTRGRRFCFVATKTGRERVAHTQYTQKQLEYIAMLLKTVLAVKANLLRKEDSVFNSLEDATYHYHSKPNPVEDLLFILASLVQEAKDRYFQYNKISNLPKAQKHYNLSVAKLIDLVRNDKELLSTNLEDDMIFVKTILKWLYKTLDCNKKQLGPILRPYLNNLFVSSHAISWHLDSIKSRDLDDEAHALGVFCKLVNDKEITPAQGLVDAVNKNWNWAKEMLNLVQERDLRLVFVNDERRVLRHLLSVPGDHKRTAGFVERSRSVSDYDIGNGRSRGCFTNLVKTDAIDGPSKEIPPHIFLAQNSVLTKIYDSHHRRGDHRCQGEILETLLTMHKMNILQELSTLLPSEERMVLLETIQKLCTNQRNPKQSNHRSTLPNLARHRAKSKPTNSYKPLQDGGVQRYTKTDDFLQSNEGCKTLDLGKVDLNKISLIGSCRNARIRETKSVFIVEEAIKMRTLNRKAKESKK